MGYLSGRINIFLWFFFFCFLFCGDRWQFLLLFFTGTLRNMYCESGGNVERMDQEQTLTPGKSKEKQGRDDKIIGLLNPHHGLKENIKQYYILTTCHWWNSRWSQICNDWNVLSLVTQFCLPCFAKLIPS